jgi:L-threonylcarbamoyladenylate synthase
MGRPVAAAVRALAGGALVVHPTDTLFALAARARDRRAVARLVAAKGRAEGHPLSVAVSSAEELERWGRLGPGARRWVRDRLPGPYTILVEPTGEARRSLAGEVAGGPTVGLRLPDHPLARELARCAGPIVATSANRSGEPPSRSIAEARRALGRAVAVYLDGPPRPSGVPSTLVDLTRDRVRTVRRR